MNTTSSARCLASRLESMLDHLSELHQVPLRLEGGLELTPREMHALQALGERPGGTVSGLGERLRVTKSAASQMVSRLCGRDLAVKRRKPGNNKEWRLYPTELGEQVRNIHARMHEQGLRELESALAGFGSEELETAGRVLAATDALFQRRLARSARGQGPEAGRGPGHRRGPSSFHMQDPETVFANLRVRPGEVCLDLGCGPGDYALRLAGLVGPNGRVHALDRDASTVARLEREGPDNLVPHCLDITQGLPFDDAVADLCLAATVLHIFGSPERMEPVLREARRVLRPGGRLAVIECKKEDQPWGPPRERRLAPEQVEAMASACGLEKTGLVDLGKTYLITFRPA